MDVSNYEKNFRDRGSGLVVEWECLFKKYNNII